MIKKALGRAREIFLYSDSEPNEILIGILHMLILPFAMLEIGKTWIVLQIFAHLVGAFNSLPCYSTEALDSERSPHFGNPRGRCDMCQLHDGRHDARKPFGLASHFDFCDLEPHQSHD